MSNQQSLIGDLEAEFDREVGFFGQLREGVFDETAAKRFLALFMALEVDDQSVSRRLVRLIWFIPVFLQWQEERFAQKQEGSYEEDVAAIESVLNQVVTLLEDVVGVP